uniref:Complex I 24 kDa protein n=1 Tax=Stygiella incarcerata TaxID=1712417 RepID=A0A192ZIV8_9EUKA|nr:complex I 24 kDa protein [Stygiella incarcerata]|eukprot:TRINITY_DN81104_c0_g1_i1.p1 TRINITY_DN81104_c0_g1~~TRINITY_DN81104_c0_g1_i1.p1  ORF type:complete len:248 (+),score=61.43 TRINITY_DN81104_c0_g1_i1:107-850(+)
MLSSLFRGFSSPVRSLSIAGVRTFSNVLDDAPADLQKKFVGFDFSPKMYEKIEVVMKKYPETWSQCGILPLLDFAQRQCGGWVPHAAMKKIANLCHVSSAQVYEVSKFFSMINRRPVGKYHIHVCMTTPCMVTGGDDVLAALEKHLGVKVGEVTADGLFSIGEMECMGCCANAPMIAVADYTSSDGEGYSYDYFEDLTPAKAVEIVESLRRGSHPAVGPQNGRKNAEGIQGRTTLKDFKAKPECRDL